MIVKNHIRSWLSRMSATIMRLGEERRLHELRLKLSHCGERASLRYPIYIEQPEKVRIGADVSLNPFIHIWGGGGVEIGDRTMIASHAALITLTHDPDSPQMHATLIEAPIQIASDVWIGSHACILPGVRIGEHAVVAAGSVVRSDVPAYAVVGGVPAKVLRMKEQGAAGRPPIV